MEYPDHTEYECFSKPCSSKNNQPKNNLLDIINNFKEIPIRKWSYMDTLDWAASVCKKNAIPLNSEVNLTVFQNVNGEDLLGFSLQDFTHRLGHVYGSFFFKQFQRFRAKQEKRQQESVYTMTSTRPLKDSMNLSDLSESMETLQPANKDLSDLVNSIPLRDLFYAGAALGGVSPDADFLRNEPEQRFSETSLALPQDAQEPPCFSEQNQGSSSLFPEDLTEIYSSPYPIEQNERSTLSYSVDQNEWSTLSYSVDQNECSTPSYSVDQNQWLTSAQPIDQSECSMPCSSANQIEPLGTTRPSMGSQESSIFESIPTNMRRGRTRGPKSYEFLLRLLSNPLSNPRLIEWVDREQGVFRLVDKDEIARLWGTREYKGREKQVDLTYDNFARALRYYYSSKTLLPVLERNFQYKFGPKVMEIINDSEQ